MDEQAKSRLFEISLKPTPGAQNEEYVVHTLQGVVHIVPLRRGSAVQVWSHDVDAGELERILKSGNFDVKEINREQE